MTKVKLISVTCMTKVELAWVLVVLMSLHTSRTGYRDSSIYPYIDAKRECVALTTYLEKVEETKL